MSIVTPVCAHQLHAAKSGEGDSLEVDGKPMGIVTLCGVVRNIQSKTTKVTYRVQDHTGAIDCVQWIDEGDGEAKDSGAREGMYVIVAGQLKSFDNVSALTAHHVRPVTDSNEITAHLMDTLFSHLLNTKGDLDAKAAPAMPSGGTFTAGPAQTINSGAYGAVGGEADGFTADQRMVLSEISANGDEAGASVSSISSALAGRLNESKIRETIEWLSNEGHVYSTIDDDHFKSTDS